MITVLTSPTCEEDSQKWPRLDARHRVLRKWWHKSLLIWTETMISVVKKFRQQKKKPTIETANNLDGSPGQYAKWKKPVLEGEMLHSPVCITLSTWQNLDVDNSKSVVTGCRVVSRGDYEEAAGGILWRDGTALYLDCGGGLIALYVGQNCIKLCTHAPAHTLARPKYTVHCTKVIFPVAYYVIDMQDIPSGGGWEVGHRTSLTFLCNLPCIYNDF